MKVGMLWLDDDKRRSLEEKVKRAADYYESKYGRSPNMCYVNTNSLDQEQNFGDLRVAPVNTVLPHHFWLGIFSPEGKN